MANTTWNPSDKTASVTLSNGNLTAVTTAAGGGVRAVDRQITGKFYFEVTATAWASQSNIGVAYFGANLANIFTTVLNVAVLSFNGKIWVNGVDSGVTLGARANGDIVGVAVDLVNTLIWFRVAPSGNWNGNAGFAPGGTGGVSIAPMSGIGVPVYPVVCSLANSTFTANFGDTAFTGAVPAGFTSGFTAGATPPLNAIPSQIALEHFFAADPPAQVTQVTIEQWATTATISGQAMVTQVALEQWVPAITVSNVDLAGNLGGVSQYGRFKYGKGHYSRVDAFAPLLAADLTIAPVVNLAGGFAPTIVLAADLDVHMSLVMLRGDLAPQIALEGALSLLVPLDSLIGSFGFSVVYGASSFISEPLWAGSEPCPTPPWAESEPCPVPPWMMSPPSEPVVWSKTRLCNG